MQTFGRSQYLWSGSKRTNEHRSYEFTLSCIGRESNPGLADISDLRSSDGNGQFYH
jgi:hypothetical protein